MLSSFNLRIPSPEPPAWKSDWQIDMLRRRKEEKDTAVRAAYKAPLAPKPPKPPMRPKVERTRSRRVAMRTCAKCPKKINAANTSGFCKSCWTQDMLDRTYGDKHTCQDCNSCIGRRPNARFCKPCGKKSANRSYKARAKARLA